MRGKQYNPFPRRTAAGPGPGPGVAYSHLSQGFEPTRGHRQYRSVGADPAAPAPAPAAPASTAKEHLKKLEDVLKNTAENVFPYLGLAVGIALRKNPIARIAAPLAGLALGVARAAHHAHNKQVADAAKKDTGKTDGGSGSGGGSTGGGLIGSSSSPSQ